MKEVQEISAKEITAASQALQVYTKQYLLDELWPLVKTFLGNNQNYLKKTGITPYYNNELKSNSTKDEIGKHCAIAFANKQTFELFTESFAPETNQLLYAILLGGPIDVVQISEKFGITVIEENQVSGSVRHSRKKYQVNKAFQFFSVYNLDDYYYWGNNTIRVFLGLPHPIREHLNRILYPGKPNVYTFDELPDTPGLNIFEGEHHFIMEFPGWTAYIQQKPLDVNSSGRAKVPYLKSAQKKLNLSCFFPGNASDNQRLSRMAFLAAFSAKTQAGAGKIPIHEQLKSYIHRDYAQFFFSAQILLTYLKNSSRLSWYDRNSIEPELLRLFKVLPVGVWIDYESWETAIKKSSFSHVPLRLSQLNLSLDINSKEFRIPTGLYERYIQWPVIRGTFFYFAALGLFDIAYCDIESAKIGLSQESPYDGLKYFRITPLGAYVLGKTEAYQSAVKKPFKLSLSDDALTILVEEGNVELAGTTLQSFTVPVGARRFRTDAAPFLSNCRQPEDLDAKINIFKSFFSDQSLPPVWVHFFKDLKQKVNPLQPVTDYQIFSIPADNTTLVKLIAQDEVLRSLCSKAEGYRILVKSDQYNKFKKRLQEFGYLLT